ncbi:MAG TPA: ADP-ribosylglycohydrolase family protein [Verrucomicrobiae bacterium]|nr:ADP-ribosylglycohydrolase family protein [Verrucomicrobiae bacterium]
MEQSLAGVLTGTAVGDALGLPFEGISRQRIRRLCQGKWRHRFLFGHGMVSDDTEHALFVAQAILTHPSDPSAFQRCLSWKLRFWLLGAPAGIGFATLKSILKLWFGVSPIRSGVWSAGNGPAMRSAIIGVYFADDAAKRRAFVSASTRLTHTDPKAETAALAVAEAAAWTKEQNGSIDDWLVRLGGLSDDGEWRVICEKLQEARLTGKTVEQFADSLGLEKSVSGYSYHSVPVALYAWLCYPDDFRAGLESALNCGGDTDTVGAIVGALLGAKNGRQSIPSDLIAGIREWPRSIAVLEKVAARLAEQKKAGTPLGPIHYFWPGLIFRNILFVIVVLLHGFRRLIPPY